MADIFISYASEDRSRTEPIAKALEEHGWSVWWDRTIPPGKTFDQVIEEAINAARCVVVLWSKKSIKSDWVKEEANIGKERKILVPAKIDPVNLPLGFGRIQAADLTNWEAEKEHPGFFSLRDAISEFAGPPPERDKSVPDAKLPESTLEQQVKIKSEESETFQPDPRYLKPDAKELPISGTKAPRKIRLALGIGTVALILVLIVIAWFLFPVKIFTASNPNGSISPKGPVEVYRGLSKKFDITPNPGYHIADVAVDGVSVGAVPIYTINNVFSDREIEASFAADVYTIKVSSNANGSISPKDPVKVPYGEDIAFTITPNLGYRIANVKVDGGFVGSKSSYTINNVTNNHSISASFEPIIAPYERFAFDPQARKMVIKYDKVKELKTVNKITIEAWFKAKGLAETQWIVYKPPKHINQQPYYHYALGFRNKNQGIYFPLALNKKGLRSIDNAYRGALKENKWYHVAATYDENNMKLYLDGKMISSREEKGTITNYETNLGIGGTVMPTSKFSLEGEIFHGELAEVRIWGVARTEKEISVAMYDSILTDAEGLLFSSTKELQSP